MAIATTLYTTRAEVRTRVSIYGVFLREDHDVADALDQSIELGSSELDFYLLGKYTEEQISENRWARSAALVFSVFHLCWLRLNSVPEVVQMQVDRLREMLDLIRVGNAILPGSAEGPDAGPEVVNTSIRLDAYPSIFVDRARSVTSDRAYPQRFGREYIMPPRV